MKKVIITVALASITLLAEGSTESNVSSVTNSTVENEKSWYDFGSSDAPLWTKTEEYNLSAESGFYLDAALVDYSELTDCEEDAKDQMADEAMATVDLCPTRNIDIRLGHPIEIQNIKVHSRKLTDDECQVEATYTLTTLPPQEMKDIDAVCQDEYNNYGASLMLQDGLWQGLQLSLGVGYSDGGVGTFGGNDIKSFLGRDSIEYRYYSAPMITTDAQYLYKIPVANMYVLAGTELSWIFEQKHAYVGAPDAEGIFDDGGSPYIFRFGLHGGIGYRFFMKYDLQAHLGYQFQYLHRTINNFPQKGNTTTFDGYENNLAFALRGAYHFHENFAVWVKVQHNTVAATGSFGVTYEFWD